MGDAETYPNLRLSIWNEEEKFDKDNYGTVKLHGELALRTFDWVDYDDNLQPYTDHLIEMGWLFRNTSSLNYDGLRVKFLYNREHTNNPARGGYSKNFTLDDMYARRLNITAEEEPLVMLQDEEESHWELVPERS